MLLKGFSPFLYEGWVLFSRKEPVLVPWEQVGDPAFWIAGFGRILVKSKVRDDTVRLYSFLNFRISQQVRHLIQPVEPTQSVKQNRSDVHVNPAIGCDHIKPDQIDHYCFPLGMCGVFPGLHEFIVVGYVLVEIALIEYHKAPVLFLTNYPHFYKHIWTIIGAWSISLSQYTHSVLGISGGKMETDTTDTENKQPNAKIKQMNAWSI